MFRLIGAVFISLAVMATSISAQIVNKNIMGLSFTSDELEINAKSDSIWVKLNTPQTLADIIGMTMRGGSKKLVEVGDGVNMTTEHDTGAVILSYVKRRTEMRFVFEPDSGTFLWQDIWKLNQVGATRTKIIFERRYVRPIPITSAQIDDLTRFLKERLARLKEMVEQK
jgi:hypothetical protein